MVLGQNLRCKVIPTNVPFVLDSIPVETASITVDASYDWEENSRTIQVKGEVDQIEVCYRVIATLLSQPVRNRDMADYDATRAQVYINQSPQVEQEELFSFGGVQKYGTITRGVSFGNRQSLLVNSSLNLQMDGQLDDNLFISAVITDQNIPYQPEGNTQQLRDFDNVFIKLYNDKFDVTVGDLVLQQPDDAGYFLRFYKNVQGIQAAYRGQSKKWRHESRVSGALSKGKFNSALVPAVDGLNGPYRLRGPNGERFIIVLANSEKVFLDGKLLERGFDRDYVIDYNLGEITFNNHIIITQFSIIRVDYEYAEQFYSRTNFSAHQSISNDRLKLFANYYRAEDNPNNNFGFNLNDNDLAVLQSIGDRSDLAFITGFDSTQFAEGRVLYERKDTVDADGTTQSIFVYTTSSNGGPFFTPSFSDVGVGNGDYVLLETTANGRVYEWVSPQNGVSTGSYQPGAFIPLPNKRQLITLGGEVKLSSYESFQAEVAFSDTDVNLYSSRDDENNVSRGYFSAIRTEGRSSFWNNYDWVGSLAIEYDEADFTFIDRYRPILFDRDWNYTPSNSEKSSDLILFMKGGLVKDESNQITTSLNRRKRAQFIDGWQQSLTFNQRLSNVQLRSSHFLLRNDQLDRTTDWVRSLNDLSYRKWKMAPGYIFEVDENEIAEADSVVGSLMHFKAHEVYLESTDSARSTYRVSYRLRQDMLPVAGSMEDYLISKNILANYRYQGEKGSVAADFNYRQVEDQLNLNVGQDEVITGRINWIQSFLDQNVKSNFSYSTGNSRELRREFIYLPVPTGEGTHTWRDNNGDGVQDLNEFFEAFNPDERNYVKIFTPTDEYVTSFQTFYVHTIDARLPMRWRSHGGFKAFAGKLSVNVNFNINFKTTSDSYADRLNPFGIKLNDTELIATQNNKRYTMFYNRNGRGLAGDFTYQSSDSKQLLTQGFESREKNEWISNAKVDLGSFYTFRVSSTIGTLLNTSDFLDSRNFEIYTYSYRPQLIWQPNTVFRLVGSFERKQKQNQFMESSDEWSIAKTYNAELTWNQAGKGSLRGSFSVVRIQFNGDETSYLGYLLLDALQPGTNQTWQVNWQLRLSKGMQLSVIYNGRKSEDVPAIHTGNVQVTAFF